MYREALLTPRTFSKRMVILSYKMRAKHYRDLAQEARRKAARLNEGEEHNAMLDLAVGYERLTETMENLARRGEEDGSVKILPSSAVTFGH